MGDDGSGYGEEAGTTSPNNRVKFLCSHSGKILPRPADGQLKYVGGETRVVAISRRSSFADLMKKLTSQFDGDMVLKYQFVPEDLDALVSVRSDEDLKHMLDEYDRQESRGNPRLRTFLFPANPTVIENQPTSMDSHSLEQRYIDAINGVVRTIPKVKIAPLRPTFSISSACSSPKSSSPDSVRHPLDQTNHENLPLNSYQQGNRPPMHKVRSSPSLCSLSYQHQSNNPSASNQTYFRHHYPNYQKPQHNGGYPSSKPPQEHYRGMKERLHPALSLGRAELGRSQMGHGPNPYYGSSQYHGGNGGGWNNCGYHDECMGYHRHGPESVPVSPRKHYWYGLYYKGEFLN